MGIANRFRTEHFTDADLADDIEVPDASDLADRVPAHATPPSVSVPPARPGDPF